VKCNFAHRYLQAATWIVRMHLQLPKKVFFFILVYGRRSKMVNLCIVQFPGQSSNAIRVLLIFQPSTYICFCHKIFSSHHCRIFARYFQLIGKSQMVSCRNFPILTTDWLNDDDERSEIKFLSSNDSLCSMRVHLTNKKNCANRIRKFYLIYLPLWLHW